MSASAPPCARKWHNIADDAGKLRVIPCDVDGDVFALPGADAQPAADQILFVGAVRHVKGVDLLLHSMRLLADVFIYSGTENIAADAPHTVPLHALLDSG